ncbi:hypothetical protein [Micromonospora sp. NPDC005173]|uniref:hypothetical protein n=1 Tax=Micromonospora sp. NPDC005173 TaxID=3157165 RepID=UPI0033AC0208
MRRRPLPAVIHWGTLSAAVSVAVSDSRGSGEVIALAVARALPGRSLAEVVTPVAVGQASCHLNRSCCDETGKTIIPGRCVDVEGNDHWRFFTDVPTHQCALVEGGPRNQESRNRGGQTRWHLNYILAAYMDSRT